MANADMKIHFSLIDEMGAVLFKEVHDLSTNEFGQINALVGSGTTEQGNFADITGVSQLTIQIEAELPGEPDIVDFGTAPVGTVPYALYGADEDADPVNEMQHISSAGDSLMLSGTPGLPLNNINYWQKTDSSFSLQFDEEGTQRSAGQSLFEYRRNRLRNLSDYGPAEAYTCSWGEASRFRDRSVFSNASTASDFNQADENQFSVAALAPNMYNACSSNESQAFVVKRAQNSISTLFLSENKSVEEKGMINEGTITQMERNGFDDGINFCEKLFDAVFALGSAVFSDDGQGRSLEGEFGGTSSTANHLGLTSLSGALPGSDLTTGFQIIFNGLNLGTVSTINGESAGTTTTHGENGQNNTLAGTFAGTPNHGAYMVFGEDGTAPTAYLRSTATVSEVAANVVTMLTEAPGRSSQVAAFSAPMGGEAAAYDRGTATLVNGEASVTCPEHFQWVADEQSMTVTITPLSAESKGIAVIEKAAGGFKVKELNGGLGNYAFDYMVMCKRKGYQDYQVLRDKKEVVPTQASMKNIPRGKISSIRELYK